MAKKKSEIEDHEAVSNDSIGAGGEAESDPPGENGNEDEHESIESNPTDENDDDEDEFELLENESEGEDESALEDVPGFEESTIETIGGGGEEFAYEDEEDFVDMGEEEFGGPESVCGRDDRVRIRATTRIPWRWSCQLLITLKDGRRSRCTGWFISPRTVMTSGHCLYSHSAGGWARSIEVVPGMDGSRRPYGSQVSRAFRSVKGWVNSRKSDYDYGAIILPRCTFKSLGYYGFASLPKGSLKNLLVNNTGYAGDKPFGTQWYNAGRIQKVTSRKLYYMIDTFGGHSGSCVWLLKKVGGRWQRYAVGVHGYGGCPNKAVRIVRPVFNNMKRWKAEGRC